MTEENKNTEEVVENTTSNSENKSVLLGAISYSDQADYEKFLEGLDINQAIFVLIASANYSQSRGIYNLDESELIAKSIKTIKKMSANSQPESESQTEPNPES